jgi:hypothetical protein
LIKDYLFKKVLVFLVAETREFGGILLAQRHAALSAPSAL